MPTKSPASPASSRSGRSAPALQHKTVDCQFKAADDGSGSFELYAAVFGNRDRQGDIIEPGAFTNLTEFVADGFGLLNHAMYELPVAWIDTAVQDQKGLKITGRFHTTHHAQALRTTITERMAAGKSVKCSIGYLTSDTADEKVDGQYVRRIKALQVYEFSFVNLPANPSAEVTAAKSASSHTTEAPMPETKTPDSASLLEALKQFFGLETKEAKPLSRAGKTRLKAFAEEMHEHGDKTKEHAKAMSEHGKAACTMAKCMKDFLKAYDPEDALQDEEEVEDQPDDEGAEHAQDKPAKGKKKKDGKPADTADGNPPKNQTLSVYTETLKHRSLLGRRHQSCP